MTRNLDPTSLAFAHELMRGAFIVLPPTTSDANGKKTKGQAQVLRFQYNPETITRTRTGAWDARKNGKVVAPSPSEKAEKDSFRGGGMFAKSETIAMKLVFDATELLLRGGDPGGDGILPELGVLETIALGEAPKEDGKKDPKNDAKLNPIHPKELLLVIGKRYFPVIITQMTITEKRFSPDLIPLRAEIDLQMQVLEATEVNGDSAIKGAYNKLVGDRLANAAKTAMGSQIDSLGVNSEMDTVNAVQGAIATALRRREKGFT